MTARVLFQLRSSGLGHLLDFACAQDASTFTDWLREHDVGVVLSVRDVTHRSHNRGTRNPNAKLTARDVRAIRWAVGTGLSRQSVARTHGVSVGCVDNVVRRRTWGHVV